MQSKPLRKRVGSRRRSRRFITPSTADGKRRLKQKPRRLAHGLLIAGARGVYSEARLYTCIGRAGGRLHCLGAGSRYRSLCTYRVHLQLRSKGERRFLTAVEVCSGIYNTKVGVLCVQGPLVCEHQGWATTGSFWQCPIASHIRLFVFCSFFGNM